MASVPFLFLILLVSVHFRFYALRYTHDIYWRYFMIYLTGDTHGDFQRIAHFCARMHTKPSDIMIMVAPRMACRINSDWLISYAASRPVKSAYSSSDRRVLTTWRRWGVLYFFRMVCDLLSRPTGRIAGFGEGTPQQDSRRGKMSG